MTLLHALAAFLGARAGARWATRRQAPRLHNHPYCPHTIPEGEQNVEPR